MAGVALGGWRCVQVGLRAQMRWEWEWEWEGPEGGCGNQGDCSGNGFISAAGGGMQGGKGVHSLHRVADVQPLL